jgi:hypothetical protein
MKRIISICLLTFILLSVSVPLFAFAIDAEPDSPTAAMPKLPSSVTITVVMPEKADSSEQIVDSGYSAAPVFLNVYPIDVTENRYNGGRQIVKTYELNASEKPSDIPRDSFERGGWKYTLTDILRKETANAETKEHKEIVNLNTDTKDMEKILALLEPTINFKTDDDFAGLLTLDVMSIKIETAGTKTSSYEMKVTREYPHLSSNDTSLVPKTTEEKGKTYNLIGVNWKTETVENIDYSDTPTSYTAIATYTATGTSTKVTGYTTTAEYNGTLAKMSQGKTIYTAYFEGDEIRIPLEMTIPSIEQIAESSDEAIIEPTAEPTEQATAEPTTTAEPDGEKSSPANIAKYFILAALAMIAGGAYYITNKNKKLRKDANNEKTSIPAVSDDADSDNDNSGVSN